MRASLRIAHLADSHLGYRGPGGHDEHGRNQRLVDAERAFEAALTAIIDERPDVVLHAGDLFHHTRPTWDTVGHLVRQLRRVEAAGIPCLVIAGNHDTPRLRSSSSVYTLLRDILPGIRFATGYELTEEAFPDLDLLVQAVPHGALTNPDQPLLGHDDELRNVIVTHGLAPRVQLRGPHEPGEERLPENLLDPDFDYIALGHFHEWGDQGRNAWYSGSTERFGWGDLPAEPGWNLVTLGPQGAAPAVEHRPVPTRPMVRIRDLAVGERSAQAIVDEVLTQLEALNEPAAMVRVEVVGAARPVRREAAHLLAQQAGGRVWHVELVAPGDPVIGRYDGDHETMTDVRVMFGRFVDERARERVYDDDFAVRFRDRGLRALEAAMEAAREATADEEGAA